MTLDSVYQIPNEPIIVAEMPYLVTYESTRKHSAAISHLRSKMDGQVYLVLDFTPCRIQLSEAAKLLRAASENPDFFWNDPQLTFIVVAHFAVANLLRHAVMQLPNSIFVPMYETMKDALEYVRCEIGTTDQC